MGYGGWREDRELAARANDAFEHLLVVLQRLGYDIERTESTMRGVTAFRSASGLDILLPWRVNSGGRVAARVDPVDDGRCRITIECAPAYEASMFGERAHRIQAKRILMSLAKSIAL